MKPEEFENQIANHFTKMGYNVSITPKSYDYGVDVIASKHKEKIAIQVKMYKSRLVNYKDVMYLHAGKDYYGCSKSLLITSGTCHPLAVKVAKKLEVEIQDNFRIKESLKKSVPQKPEISFNDEFEEVWEKHIKPLKGETIFTVRGNKNVILNITNDLLERKSSTGRVSKIEKKIFKTVFYRLLEKDSITKDEINTEYAKRGSSIITAILGKVPFITLTLKPKATLTIEKK